MADIPLDELFTRIPLVTSVLMLVAGASSWWTARLIRMGVIMEREGRGQ